MTDYKPLKAKCDSCLRKLGDDVDILQGADGTWVHVFRNGQHYPVKCNIWESYVAIPKPGTEHY